jgi:hypothetical protein
MLKSIILTKIWLTSHFAETELFHGAGKWWRHRMFSVQRMKPEERMSIWDLKDRTPMGMEKR